MTQIKTDIFVICPKINVKVNVQKQCVSGEELTDKFKNTKERCRHFKYLTYVSYGVLVCCTYPNYADMEKP